ncbi:hypothetical protein ACFE04_028789 [Oxalis oulophora]
MVQQTSLKFLCSYQGKIVPRLTDGKLRYSGGITRVLSVDRSISYTELMVKLGEFCGYSVTLRCQFPNLDLETLISIKSDEDLSNLIEEYDKVSRDSKIRAFLSPPASLKQVSPVSSRNSSRNSSLSPTKHQRYTQYSPRGYSLSPSPPVTPHAYAVNGRSCCYHHQHYNYPPATYNHH